MDFVEDYFAVTHEPSIALIHTTIDGISDFVIVYKHQVDEELKDLDGSTNSLSEKRKAGPPENTTVYTVADRDTLTSVAARFDTTPSELTKLNRLATPYIFPGQQLYVPNREQAENDSEGSTPVEDSHDDLPPAEKELLENLRPVSPKPGHVERVRTPSCPQGGSSSEYEDSESAVFRERFLKINVRHITDGQGVVSGVLLVTPNAVMFDPNVIDPLVIEHGPEAYGVIAPMEFVVNAAIYNDIAHMRVGHCESNLSEKQEIYYPKSEKEEEQDSLMVKDETFPELALLGQSMRKYSDADIVLSKDWVPPITIGATNLSYTSEPTDSPARKKTNSVSFSLDSSSELDPGQPPLSTSYSESKEDVDKADSRKNKMLKRLSYPLSWVETTLSGDKDEDKPPSQPHSAADVQHSSVFSKVFSSSPIHLVDFGTGLFHKTPSEDSGSGGSAGPHSGGSGSGGPLTGDSTSSSFFPTNIISSVGAMGAQVGASVGAMGAQVGASVGAMGAQVGASVGAMGATVGAMGAQVGASVGAVGRSSVGTFMRQPTESSSKSKTPAPKLDYRSMVSVEDMPELFVSFDKLIPRPARSCDDPPLYLRLRMGKPLNKVIPRSTPLMSYGKKKMRPEYWFSVPKNRIDELYKFIQGWVPHLYGELDEEKIMYKLYCEENESSVSRPIYEREFHKMNISFKKPKVDTCHKCDVLSNKLKVTKSEGDKTKIKDEISIHHTAADNAYVMKSNDTEKAKCDSTFRCLTFDLQQCLATPYVNSSVAFYKRQLWTYNLTIHENGEGSVACYMWHEGE
uniref:Nuclear receptor coactivator 7-like n=1 Tax=Diabrotica virgifera virgifera TaxID=50390 RepID=A0A6P7G1E7_DIAVI